MVVIGSLVIHKSDSVNNVSLMLVVRNSFSEPGFVTCINLNDCRLIDIPINDLMEVDRDEETIQFERFEDW